MSISDSYSDWAATYDHDRNLTRDLDQRVMRDMFAAERCASILELGCGTGKNTGLLAASGTQVRALDFSEGMIARARAKISAANVTFSVADLTMPWPCGDQAVDLIVCNLVLEHIADLGFIFAEARRVLRAPGRFFVSELHPFRQYQGSVANFQQGGARIAIPAFTHHISEFVLAAEAAGLGLAQLREWWHEEDAGGLPRLVTLLFAR